MKFRLLQKHPAESKILEAHVHTYTHLSSDQTTVSCFHSCCAEGYHVHSSNRTCKATQKFVCISCENEYGLKIISKCVCEIEEQEKNQGENHCINILLQSICRITKAVLTVKTLSKTKHISFLYSTQPGFKPQTLQSSTET